MLGHENMNPVPFATAHECYNSLWRRQWASQWAVLVRGQSVKHSRQARWHEASKWLLASTFCLPDSAQIANEQNKQKAHCGNAQEFLCKKGKKQTKAEKHTEIVSEAEHTPPQGTRMRNTCRWPPPKRDEKKQLQMTSKSISMSNSGGYEMQSQPPPPLGSVFFFSENINVQKLWSCPRAASWTTTRVGHMSGCLIIGICGT